MQGRTVSRAIGLGFLLASCGGQVDDPTNDTNGRVGQDDSVGGSVATASGTGGTASAVGGAGGTPSLGAGGSSTSGPDECMLPWWGSSLDGVPGLFTCPEDPYDPALLAYGQSRLEPCTQVSGPPRESVTGEQTKCCYRYDETSCGNDYVGEWCIELPYFGDGTAELEAPTAPVDFEDCALPAGPESFPATQQEWAAHMTGVWLLCSPGGLFTTDAVVFRGDGTFQFLVRDERGVLVEAEGCDDGGLWGFISNPGGQLMVYVADRTAGFLLRFYDDGSALRFETRDFSGAPVSGVRIE